MPKVVRAGFFPVAGHPAFACSNKGVHGSSSIWLLHRTRFFHVRQHARKQRRSVFAGELCVLQRPRVVAWEVLAKQPHRSLPAGWGGSDPLQEIASPLCFGLGQGRRQGTIGIVEPLTPPLARDIHQPETCGSFSSVRSASPERTQAQRQRLARKDSNMEPPPPAGGCSLERVV